ncbi:MAG: YIP1 family protein [Caldilineaceae bacterium]|nr:YIP1 family protein [Caldilineaceae bacterium]
MNYISLILQHAPNAEDTLPGLAELIRRALALDPTVYRLLAENGQGLGIALLVVALAGLSEGLAQSIVLFINRITPRRFVLSLLLSAATHAVGYLFWAATIWLVGMRLFGRGEAFAVVARAVGLAYAPQLFGFFILTPYLGSLFSLVIAVWTLLATVVAVHAGLGLTIWQAVACSAVGWLLVQIARRTLGRPLLAFERWAENRAAGVPLHWTVADLRRMRLPADWQTRFRRNRRQGGGDG